ncbi:MAG: glycosyltransferase family 4 protein [Bacteroidales bacterium]|nr:glycosyltransferase family 4 protein [Bacteroidales bacterium]
MKILLIFHSSSMQGGANVSGLNMLRGLRRLGHNVCVLLPTAGELSRRLEEEGFDYKIIYFRQAWPYTIGSPMSMLKFIPRKIKEMIANRRACREIGKWVANEVQPDLIHSNSSVTDVGFVVARRLGLPHISHFREYGYRDTGFPMWHVRRMIRYPRQNNIAVSEDISRFHSLPAERSEVIYNGIYSKEDYPEMPAPAPEKDDYLLYVGGLYAAKGIDDILEAYAGLDPYIRSKHPLVLVGAANSPQYEKHLRNKADKLGISQCVKWLGSRNDVADLMQHARALVIASHSEAFGRIMAEAAFNRCPVIARDRKGLHEQFEQGRRISGMEIGLRFDDVDSLRNCMRHILTSDYDESAEMTDSAYLTARCLYTNEANAAHVSEFYKSLTKK